MSMPKPEYTPEQAADLLRYFLPDWVVMPPDEGIHPANQRLIEIRHRDHRFDVLPPMMKFHTGETWREVFRRAGVKLPARPRFANVGRRVMVGPHEVAICTSNSYADRIARLLNRAETA